MTHEEDVHHYFAYGANLDPERMKRRCGESWDRRPARLPDHRLVFNKATNDFDGSASANIEQAPGEEVQGALYTLTENGLHRVDQVEGHPRHYTRRLHAILESDGTKTIAWVYHATPAYVRDRVAPREEYLQTLLAGADVLSEDYLQWLKQVPVFR